MTTRSIHYINYITVCPRLENSDITMEVLDVYYFHDITDN